MEEAFKHDAERITWPLINFAHSSITKVTQNNTGMYTKGSSQQTFGIPNNNLDVKFEKAYQNHNNETVQTNSGL